MAVRNAGVRLEIQNLAQYLSGARQVEDANKRIKASLDSSAEFERRATIAARSAAQQRGALARAESQERIQAARAATTRIIEEERRATATLRAELAQRAAAQRSASSTPAGVPGGAALGGVARAGLGIGLGLLGIQGAQQVLGTVVELDQLRGQALRTETALNALAGGGGQASAAIRQIQSVAPGATSQLQASQAAVTILTQRLNSSAVSIGEIAKAISIIPQVSPSIRDQSDAIGQLTLFSNSASFARADQLAVTAEDVKNRVQELSRAFPELSDAQLKAAATVQLVNERFAALGDSAAAQVTGVQKLQTAFDDLKLSIATGGIGPVDDFFGGIASGLNFVQGQLDPRQTDVLRGGLQRRLESAREGVSPTNTAIAGVLGIQDDATTASRLEQLAAVQRQVNEAFEAGTPGIDKFVVGVNELVQNAVLFGNVTDGEQEQLRQLHADFLLAAAGADEFAASQAAAAAAQAEAAAAFSRQELQDARAEIDQLAKSSLDLFAAGAPGADELSKSLLELQAKLVTSAELTDEDRAALDALGITYNVVAAAAGQSVGGLDAAAQAKLNDQVAAYQDAQANQVLAQSLQAVAAAQAGVSRGIVSGLSGLIGAGTINSGQAGALNRALQGQAQARFAALPAGLTPDQAAFAQAQIQRDTSGKFLNDLAAIETKITREAQEQHRAAQGGAKEWADAEKSAAKAAKATLAMLEKVPGLFGTSPVTQEQMDAAKAGIPQNFADDFLRQLEDEVLNGVDREGVSIEQGREALGRIGVQAAEDPKAVLQQLREAWENSSLFANKENLALINQQAVEDNLALQKKMEDGRRNIAEFFGVAIDDTVAAIGGGGAIPPIDQEALQEQIAAAQQAFVDNMLQSIGFGSSGVSLSDRVRSGPGEAGIDNPLISLSDHLRSADEAIQKSFGDATSTADILREAFGRTTEAADVLATKINDIPPVVWENHIDKFPAWQGKEGIIDPFPGWEAWLGAEKANTGAADMGASGTTGSTTVPGPVQQGLTSPPVSSTSNTSNTTVNIASNQSTGSLVADWAILQAQGQI